MFGALLGLIGLGGCAADSMKTRIRDDSKRIDANSRGQLIYTDSNFVERSVKTGNKVSKMYSRKEITYYRDRKTGEVIEDINPYMVRKKQQEKEEAQRRGYPVYCVHYAGHTIHYLTKNDLEVVSDGCYFTPKFKLKVNTYNENETKITKENRKNLYKWYRELWYKNGESDVDFKKEILNMANTYEIKVFEEDIDFCQDALKNGTFSKEYYVEDDKRYAELDGIDKDYWLSWR